jgi:hypothetical protein
MAHNFQWWQLRPSEGTTRRINMLKKGHAEKQIISALKQYEAEEKTPRHPPEAGCEPGDVLYVEAAVYGPGRAGSARTAIAA